MGVIDTAVRWAVDIANDDSYKYVWGGWERVTAAMTAVTS